jgi:hypothetical protein
MPKKPSAPEVDQILEALDAEPRQILLILFVPSHDKHNKALTNQDIWAGEAMEVFKELYRGATAFMTYAGIYLDDTGKTLHDKPILIECFAEIKDVKNHKKLEQLVAFMKRMGKETKQAAVGLVVANTFHYVTDY